MRLTIVQQVINAKLVSGRESRELEENVKSMQVKHAGIVTS